MISIIIPALNEEKYIEKTLKSIHGSDYRDYEIIVVANRCTDNTAKIAKRLADKVIIMNKNGVSRSRNIGAREAKGNILVFLDADTLLTKNTLTKISNLKGVGTCKVKPDSNRLIAKTFMLIKNLLWWTVWTNGIISCEKEIFNKINGFNENMSKGEDGDFVRRAKRYGKYKLADSYVINSMRRFEKWGYFNVCKYWIKERISPSKEDYPIVR